MTRNVGAVCLQKWRVNGEPVTSIRLIAYQCEVARPVLSQRYCLAQHETADFIQPSGKVLPGLDVFSPVLPNLPGGTPMLWELLFGRVRKLAEWGYCFVARHQYR